MAATEGHSGPAGRLSEVLGETRHCVGLSGSVVPAV